jgi:hypothetical protein
LGLKDIGPAIRHLDEVRAVSPVFFEILAVSIGAFEVIRSLKGWEVGTGQPLKDDYYPGDIGTSKKMTILPPLLKCQEESVPL